LSNDLSTKGGQSSYFSWLGQTAEAGVDHLFERLPLKFSNAAIMKSVSLKKTNNFCIGRL
jgi:hypothetical protein